MGKDLSSRCGAVPMSHGDHMADPLNGFAERKVALVIIDVQNKFVDPTAR